MREGEVLGSKYASHEVRDFHAENATICDFAGGWLTGGHPRIKIKWFFFYHFCSSFWKLICTGGLKNRSCWGCWPTAPINHSFKRSLLRGGNNLCDNW